MPTAVQHELEARKRRNEKNAFEGVLWAATRLTLEGQKDVASHQYLQEKGTEYKAETGAPSSSEGQLNNDRIAPSEAAPKASRRQKLW